MLPRQASLPPTRGQVVAPDIGEAVVESPPWFLPPSFASRELMNWSHAVKVLIKEEIATL